MGDGEVVGAEPSLVEVAPEHVEAAFVEFGGDVGVAEGVVAHLRFVLGVECHGGRMVGVAVIACVIIAVDAYHEVEHFECREAQVHVRVDCECRQRNDVLIRRHLICDGIVPVPDSEAEFLVEGYGEHLHVASVLFGEGAVVEVDVVLKVAQSGGDCGAGPGDYEASADVV